MQNLNFGSQISSAQHHRDNCLNEKYCWLDNNDFCNNFGALYQWDEIMRYEESGGFQDFCPPGWHIPNEQEWDILFYFFSSDTNKAVAGRYLKSGGGSGYEALLNGISFNNSIWKFGSGDPVLHSDIFWSASSHGSKKAWAHGINKVLSDPYFTPSVNTYPALRNNGFAVRCLKE